MYELADWGSPAPPDWMPRSERLEARLPADLVRQVRARAQAEGLRMTEYLELVLREAVDPRAVMVALAGDAD
jgi:predicted DNA binding CopG/RHH family protein